VPVGPKPAPTKAGPKVPASHPTPTPRIPPKASPGPGPVTPPVVAPLPLTPDAGPAAVAPLPDAHVAPRPADLAPRPRVGD
jgi:hypothetical protein